MKGILLSTALSTLLSHHANTQLQTPNVQPASCPDITAITAAGLDYAVPYGGIYPDRNQWIGIKENSSYGTKDNWSLVILNWLNIRNIKMALRELSSELATTHLMNDKPEWDKYSEVYVCMYSNEDNPTKRSLQLYAFTPSLDS